MSAATELIFGLVSPIGADRNKVHTYLTDALALSLYKTHRVKVSKTIEEITNSDTQHGTEHDRIRLLMDEGNRLRSESNHNGILGLLAIQSILKYHDENPDDDGRNAFIIDSLKHPDEAHTLRQTYGRGFFLIALHVDTHRRKQYLHHKGLGDEEAKNLIQRDEDDGLGHGQSTRDTFQLADFYVHYNGNEDKLRNSLTRIVNLIFGHPFTPPTFNEYAMYIAFASAMRSGDLSRQVGATLTRDHRIIATGANDVPKYGGGPYWPTYDDTKKDIVEPPGGRDYIVGHDTNQHAIADIIGEIEGHIPDSDARAKVAEAIKVSRLRDITEFGRAVHAEMDALLSCARSTESTQGTDLYTTTFPCHNCAKHIISAGVHRVYFIEPYPKSRALAMHSDAMSEDKSDLDKKTVLRPFVGVGPRRFVDCFSLSLGPGPTLKRKETDGTAIKWIRSEATPRFRMLPVSYLDLERDASDLASKLLEGHLDD